MLTAKLAIRSLFIALTLVSLTGPAAAADASISPAETLLFDTDHLQAITPPEWLSYRFKKDGNLEAGFEDDVVLAIRSGAHAGRKRVSTEFLSGNHRKEFPPVEAALGNPVLMYFLERDIQEMQRLTGGNWRYFQKRIRLALANNAQVRPIDIQYDGKQVPGQEVRITPYADDPQRSRYQQFAGKYYLFVLSDQVPGGVYQIRAVIPDRKLDSVTPELMNETLTFSKASSH